MSAPASSQGIRKRAVQLLERYANALIQDEEGSIAIAPEKSTAIIVGLLDKCLALEDDETYVRLLDRFGVRLQREYHLSQVEGFLATVLRHEALSDAQRVAFADLRVRILIQLGEQELAQATLDNVWPAARTPELRARVLNRQGYLYAIYSQYKEAESAYRAGIVSATAGEDMNILAILHSNYGDMLYQKGEYRAAIEQYKLALEIARPLDLVFPCALAEGGWGMTLDQLGEYDAALLHHQAARTYYEKAGDEFGLIRMSLNLSYNALCRGDYEQVKALAGQALTEARERGDLQRMAFAHQRLGEAFLITKEYEVACEHFLLALEMRRQIGKPIYIRRTISSLQELMQAVQDDPELAPQRREMVWSQCRRALEAAPDEPELPPA